MAILPQRIMSLTDEKSIAGEQYIAYVFTFNGLHDPINSVVRVVGPKSVDVNSIWGNRRVTDEAVANFVTELYQRGFVGLIEIQMIQFNG